MKQCNHCGEHYPDSASVCAIDAQPLVQRGSEPIVSDSKRQDPTKVKPVILAFLRTRIEVDYRIKQVFMFFLGFIGTFLICIIASVLLGKLASLAGDIAAKFAEGGAGAGIGLLISSVAEEWESRGFCYGVWAGYGLYLIVLLVHIFEITR